SLRIARTVLIRSPTMVFQRGAGSFARDAFPPGRKLGGAVAMSAVGIGILGLPAAMQGGDAADLSCLSEQELRWISSDLDLGGDFVKEFWAGEAPKEAPMSMSENEELRWLFADLAKSYGEQVSTRRIQEELSTRGHKSELLSREIEDAGSSNGGQISLNEFASICDSHTLTSFPTFPRLENLPFFY
ncbi:unnamed protein product, partial [Polarella glacialis]